MATIIGAAEIIAAMAEEEAEVLDAAAAVAAVAVDTTTTVVVEAAVISAGVMVTMIGMVEIMDAGEVTLTTEETLAIGSTTLGSTTVPGTIPRTRIMVAEEVIHTTVTILGRKEATMTGEVTMTGLRPRETTL